MAKDATEITKLHRWLMQEEPALNSLFQNLDIFHLSLEVDDEYSHEYYCSTPPNGTMHVILKLCFV